MVSVKAVKMEVLTEDGRLPRITFSNSRSLDDSKELHIHISSVKDEKFLFLYEKDGLMAN